MQQDVATSLFAPPSLLGDMAKKPDSIDLLSKLEHVAYVGGPLPEHAGKTLAPRLKHLCSLIGATENGFFHTLAGASSEWAYIQFNPNVGYRFDEVSPGLYELVIPKNPATNHFHGTVYTFPDLNEYRTRDLYTVVPGQTGWVRYEGRRDDLIVLSNGEKINPVPLEGIISSHPAVKGAVIVGEYRFLPCLLVELKEGYAVTTPEERQQVLDSLWPVINTANMQAPRFFAHLKSPRLHLVADRGVQQSVQGDHPATGQRPQVCETGRRAVFRGRAGSAGGRAGGG